MRTLAVSMQNDLTHVLSGHSGRGADACAREAKSILRPRAVVGHSVPLPPSSDLLAAAICAMVEDQWWSRRVTSVASVVGCRGRRVVVAGRAGVGWVGGAAAAEDVSSSTLTDC